MESGQVKDRHPCWPESRMKLPSSLVSVAHRLAKQVRRRSSSPQHRDPLEIPPVFPISHAHSTHVPTPVSPPPSYIVAAISPDGGIRRILLPDRHPDHLFDPCGIVVCQCDRPTDPKSDAIARFHQWSELKQGAIPTIYGKEHFISSPAIVIENLDISVPGTSGAPPNTTVILIRLPAEISEARDLTGVDETTLLQELTTTLTHLDQSPETADITDQIYIHLLAVDPPESEKPSAPLLLPPPKKTDEIYHQIREADASLQSILVMLTSQPPGLQQAIQTLCDTAGCGAAFSILTENLNDDGAVVFMQEMESTVTFDTSPTKAHSLLSEYQVSKTVYIDNLVLYQLGEVPAPLQGATFLAELDQNIYSALLHAMYQQSDSAVPQPSSNPYINQPQLLVCRTCPGLFPTLGQLQEHEKIHNPTSGKKTRSRTKSKTRHSSRHPSNSSTSASESDTEDNEGLNESQYMTPEIILDPTCPDIFLTYWHLSARGYDKRRHFASPHFTESVRQAEVDLAFDNIPEREFLAWARAYSELSTRSALGRIQTAKLKIGVRNTLEALQARGRREVITTIRMNAPVLTPQRISELNSQAVTQYFHELRVYVLQSAVQWDSFYAFTINQRTIGEAIFSQLNISLGAHPTLKDFSTRVSTYIESLVLRLVPAQESYWLRHDDIVHQHISQLTSTIPTAEFLKINLDAHAAQLAFLHPFVKKIKNSPTGGTQDQIRTMNESISLGLLHKILQSTPYATQLSMIYIGQTTFKTLTDVPKATLIQDLDQIILTEREKQITSAATVRTRAPQKESKQPKLRNLQKCDICTQFKLSCLASENHCRIRNHQPKSPRMAEYVKANTVKFHLRQNCKKCHQEKTPKSPAQRNGQQIRLLQRPANAVGATQHARGPKQERPMITYPPDQQQSSEPHVPQHSQPLQPRWNPEQQKKADELTRQFRARPRTPQNQYPRPGWQPRLAQRPQPPRQIRPYFGPRQQTGWQPRFPMRPAQPRQGHPATLAVEYNPPSA